MDASDYIPEITSGDLGICNYQVIMIVPNKKQCSFRIQSVLDLCSCAAQVTADIRTEVLITVYQ